jgi:hypothetical protein
MPAHQASEKPHAGLRFLRDWVSDANLPASAMVAFELYPWHSIAVTGKMRPDPSDIESRHRGRDFPGIEVDPLDRSIAPRRHPQEIPEARRDRFFRSQDGLDGELDVAGLHVDTRDLVAQIVRHIHRFDVERRMGRVRRGRWIVAGGRKADQVVIGVDGRILRRSHPGSVRRQGDVQSAPVVTRLSVVRQRGDPRSLRWPASWYPPWSPC